MPPVEGPAPDTATRLARLSIGVLRNPRSGANVRGGAAMRDALAAHTESAVPRRHGPGERRCRVARPREPRRRHRRDQRRRWHGARRARHDLRQQPVSPAAAPRRAAWRHRQHDCARHRNAGPPAPCARRADRGIRSRRRGPDGDRAFGDVHRPRRRTATAARNVLRRGGDRAGHRILQAQDSRARPARRDRTGRHDGALRHRDGTRRARDRRACARSLSRSTMVPLRASIARSSTSRRSTSWCWD